MGKEQTGREGGANHQRGKKERFGGRKRGSQPSEGENEMMDPKILQCI